jgi:hypothetical protein
VEKPDGNRPLGRPWSRWYIQVEKPEGNKPLGRPWSRWYINIEVKNRNRFAERGLIRPRLGEKWRAIVYAVMKIRVT